MHKWVFPSVLLRKVVWHLSALKSLLETKKEIVMKVRLFAKVVAVLVFAFGAIAFASANFKNLKEKPKSFVITYLLTRSENGETPVVTGLIVKTVAADGQWKQIRVRRPGDGYQTQVSVRFLDETAG